MDNFAIGGNGMSQVLQDANTITLGGNDLAATQSDTRTDKNKKTRTVTELLRAQNDEVLLKRKQKETRHQETSVALLNLQQIRAKEGDGGESIHKIADFTKDLMGLITGGGIAEIAMDHALSPAEEKSGQKQPEAPQKPIVQPLMTQAEA